MLAWISLDHAPDPIKTSVEMKSVRALPKRTFPITLPSKGFVR